MSNSGMILLTINFFVFLLVLLLPSRKLIMSSQVINITWRLLCALLVLGMLAINRLMIHGHP